MVTSPHSNLLVIGGNSSLSQEIIRHATKLNYCVYLTDRVNSRSMTDGTKIKLDLTNDLDVENFLEELKGIKFDLIVFTIGELSNLQHKFTVNRFRKYLDTHITNTILVIKKSLLILEEEGTFIYISSRSANNKSFDPYYSAGKSAIQAFLKSYTSYLPVSQRIYSIAPSLIEDSNMYKQMSAEDHIRHRLRANGSLLSLENVSMFIWSLHLNKSNFETGEIIPIGNEE
jgi:NAD(P)-dependent dehydrogenase (short-subunit alcohol dehydrogenase family)